MAVVSAAEAGLRAVERGATLVQLRAPRLTTREVEDEARKLVRGAVCPVLISSRCDLALAVDAAGVNLPERDISIGGARRLIGDRLLGRSVHSVGSALDAQDDGADFVIFGPVWASASHPGQPARGLDDLAEVVRAVRIPVIAIGGVNERRAEESIRAGAAGFAAISMFQ